MSKYQHISVLHNEVLAYLQVHKGGTYVDATFGGGGHSRALLAADPTCRVIAFDWDSDALEYNGTLLEKDFPNRIKLVWSNFARIGFHLKQLHMPSVQGILADFGTSQYQITHKEGFSFDKKASLDMRMSTAHQKVTAATIINEASAEELTYIIGTYGEEPYAYDLAQLIVEKRKKSRLTTTQDLVDLILKVIPRIPGKIHPATRTFQALRIVVNKELDHIDSLLKQAPQLICSQGRLVCISFHSLEDRLVKHSIMQQPTIWKNLTRQVIKASESENEANPSSRSARLRAAERL